MIAEAGCEEVLIGFESPTAVGLDGIELRRNWKRKKVDGYRSAIDLLQSNGIAVNACFVLGLDGDGPEVFEAVRRFVEETQPFDVQLTVMTPFPGTPLYVRLLREDRILHVGDWARCTLFDVNFRPARMSVEELEEGLLRIGLPLRRRRDAPAEGIVPASSRTTCPGGHMTMDVAIDRRAVEMTGDPRFRGRVRRLAITSGVASVWSGRWRSSRWTRRERSKRCCWRAGSRCRPCSRSASCARRSVGSSPCPP